MRLNERQQKIINILKRNEILSPSEIHCLLDKSRPIVNRDLLILLQNNLVIQTGSGRATKYRLNQKRLLREFSVEEYYKVDYRTNIIDSFNMDIFIEFGDIFTKDELNRIDKLNQMYRNKLFGQTSTGIQKELERLAIDFSWKSSSIEGNTYTLLDTEILIKESIKAKGHSDFEAKMILNQKETLFSILESKEYYKEITVFKLEELHQLISMRLSIGSGIRRSRVGIIGTNYFPLDNEFSIREALERLLTYLNSNANPVEKALIAVAMISYIQPFEDGNKRISRMLCNAILIANNLMPISFVGVDNLEYKKAIILFYEQNSIAYLKQLFLEQYELANRKYL